MRSLKLRLAVGLILAATAALADVKYTSTPAFCSRCHEMKPEFATWAASAHRKVACVDCHIEPGLANFVKHKILALNQVRQHLGKSYRLPIELPHPIRNEVCLQCHSGNREPTPAGDIKIPHRQHLEKDISCVVCHSGVAHGLIAEREQTIDGEFARWTPALGRSQMVRPYRAIKMDGCQECHKEEGVSAKCETCHTEIVKPQDHREGTWEKEHGPRARRKVADCDRCHSITSLPLRVRAETPVAEYARSNTFCQTCHEKRPPGHREDFRQSHAGSLGPEKDPAPCQACHDTRSSRASPKAAKSTCNQCHASRHRFNWTNHPVKVGHAPKIDAACLRCHNRKVCGRCHLIR